ncbi:hypothetical protein [Streptomyces hygroscopicus]|uniref:hypothetical protein n=1 Tax=Streptomyces hygroscopicus TaxID=1912 RepID=UPI00223EDFF6|nr:hypothetical protein [Streptomyces hygroscopicus]
MRIRMRMRVAGGLGAAAVGAAMAGAAVVGAAVPAVAAAAGLAYHGYVAMAGGQVDVRLAPQNQGPSDVTDATVRLHWSQPLAAVQRLPEGCARYDVSTVLCDTGPLAAGGVGREIRLRVGLEGTSTEVTLEIDTLWEGGSVDRTPGNDRQQVLALDTGDQYSF